VCVCVCVCTGRSSWLLSAAAARTPESECTVWSSPSDEKLDERAAAFLRRKGGTKRAFSIGQQQHTPHSQSARCCAVHTVQTPTGLVQHHLLRRPFADPPPPMMMMNTNMPPSHHQIIFIFILYSYFYLVHCNHAHVRAV
jgi:hypothetical protein